MADEIKNYATGTVIPLGDGFTGKSVLTRLLINSDLNPDEHKNVLLKTKKSYNIEIEFLSEEIKIKDEIIISTPQLYVFPGQRQKSNPYANTFEEILDIFDCFPALIKVNVLLLIYDVTTPRTLNSLDMWLRFAYVKEWITENTLIILVPNKIDLMKVSNKDIELAIQHIREFIEAHELLVPKEQVIAIKTSCLNLTGVRELRHKITKWIAERGIKGVGIKEIEETAKEILRIK
ncbi:MAG: hypothetical protein ACTSPV_19755 [Candidatus Hodarchaeales archaeon]